jgi:FKBP-type peptidyl-prolyl cis-trans isomerase 2
VTVQMIHPLAGQKIGMSVKVVGVRAATAAETEAGHAMTAPPKPPPRK